MNCGWWPGVLAPAERYQWDRSAVTLMADLRQRYRAGPLRLRVAGRSPYVRRGAPAAPCRDRFEPDIWLDGRAWENPALVPFSAEFAYAGRAAADSG